MPSQAALRGFSRERSAGIAVPADHTIARLHFGDPCFATPRHIVDAASAAMNDGYTHYPPSYGDPDLRTAIANRATHRAGRPIESAEVLVTAGSTAAIYCALTAVLDPGDEVLLFDPSYSLYATILNQIGARPVYVGMTEQLRPDRDRLERAITDRTRLVIINNPANPTGVVFNKAELRAIGQIAVSHDLLVLADEIYDELDFTGTFTSCLALPELSDRLLYVNGFSKTYAMTGWRLGYAVWPGKLYDYARKLAVNLHSCVNASAQYAGLAALTGPQDAVHKMVAEFDRRRAVVVAGLNRLPGVSCATPKGAFYAFPNVKRTGWKAKALASSLLEDAGVAIIGGPDFGVLGEGYVRLSYANSTENILKALDRMGEFLTSRKAA